MASSPPLGRNQLTPCLGECREREKEHQGSRVQCGLLGRAGTGTGGSGTDEVQVRYRRGTGEVQAQVGYQVLYCYWYRIVLYCTVYHTVLYCTVLYWPPYTVLYCNDKHCSIVLYVTSTGNV